MPANRPDHFERMRSEEPPVEALPEGAPHVTLDLLEWLQNQGFGVLRSDTGGYPGSMDHMVQTSHAVTFAAGQRSVIDHLRTLLMQA